MLRSGLSGVLLVAGLLVADATEKKSVPPDHAARMQQGRDLFRRQVRQILVQNCLDCHGGKSIKADFDLSTRETLMESGYVEDDAKSSYLYALITHAEEPHMPHGKPRLSEEAIAAIGRWIDLGAPYDRPLVERTEAEKPSTAVTDADRQFWSFQPLHQATPPRVQNEHWVRTPIDRFILARHEELNLTPRPSADRRTLIRRAYFDLLGLPPTPEEIDAFVADPDPQAYETLIDRLLGSPHYGERWARHWMDVARFAESHGYEQDYDRPNAYHYRDFLIQAFNADLPYDEFVRWQIAGDELRPDEPLALMATGFLGGGAFPTQLTEAEFESARYDELDDMTATTGVAFLGLSVGCARCHDHKFDPIPSVDYYRLASSFTTTIRSEIDVELDAAETRKKLAEWEADHQPLVAALRAYERKDEVRQITLPSLAALLEAAQRLIERSSISDVTWSRCIDPEWNRLAKRVQDHLALKPQPKLVKVQVTSEGYPHMPHHADGRGYPHFYPETYILSRGDVHQKQQVAEQGFLQVLMRDGKPVDYWQVPAPTGWTRTSFRRAALANWLTDPVHGAGHLAARVMVNRLWQHHFGRGLVATPNDFGLQGERPSHPELLDWLAADLIQHGWRLKRLHKLMMTSAVYCQSSEFDEACARIDPENVYHWRRTPQRLEAEPIRDTMLGVAGLLDRTMFGPGTLDPNMTRRSVYFFIKRSQLIPMLMLFDWPEHLVSIGRRSTTTIAPQALLFMNSPQVRHCADGFARRLADRSIEQSVHEGYRLAFGRSPTEAEQQLSLEFLKQQAERYRAAGQSNSEHLALIDFCQMLLSANEFVYVE